MPSFFRYLWAIDLCPNFLRWTAEVRKHSGTKHSGHRLMVLPRHTHFPTASRGQSALVQGLMCEPIPQLAGPPGGGGQACVHAIQARIELASRSGAYSDRFRFALPRVTRVEDSHVRVANGGAQTLVRDGGRKNKTPNPPRKHQQTRRKFRHHPRPPHVVGDSSEVVK